MPFCSRLYCGKKVQWFFCYDKLWIRDGELRARVQHNLGISRLHPPPNCAGLWLSVPHT